MERPENGSASSESDKTSLRIRRARDGDPESLAWIVDRFSPLLLAQASYRLARGLQGHYEPEDLVAEVWSVALPRLAGAPATEDGTTTALLRFLGTTLIYKVNNLMRKHLRGTRIVREGDLQESGRDAMARLSADVTGVVTRAVQREQRGEVARALSELDPLDREVVILRGVEQSANETVARLLDMKPNTVSRRYRRALEKLRDRLPDSVFAELAAG